MKAGERGGGGGSEGVLGGGSRSDTLEATAPFL